MINHIKKLFHKKKKKETYVVEDVDYISWAYWLLIISLGAFFIIQAAVNKKVALNSLFAIPAMIGILVILFILPVRLITYGVTEIIVRIRLFHTQKNVPEETVVVIGKNDFLRLSFWAAPNYDTDLLLIARYLRDLGKPFSIYFNSSIETLDKIMADKKIRTVYIVGHGRKHGFKIDGKTVVDYCRYNNKKYEKDYVYQIHCNGGQGESLVKYVVPKEHQKECLPEDGLMNSITVSQMFIDKIIKFKKYKGMKARLTKMWFVLLSLMIPMVVVLAWILMFIKMVA